jgi:uncharacterized protein YbcV (DUF1398 family)
MKMFRYTVIDNVKQCADVGMTNFLDNLLDLIKNGIYPTPADIEEKKRIYEESEEEHIKG